jgi:hypothetical protein
MHIKLMEKLAMQRKKAGNCNEGRKKLEVCPRLKRIFPLFLCQELFFLKYTVIKYTI